MGTQVKHRQQEEFLSRCMRETQQGNATAYRELLDTAAGIIRLYVRRILQRMGKGRSGAEEDLVQEVLLALHQKRHTYHPEEPFLPWLFAITRYKAIDFGRKEKRKGTLVSLDDWEDALAAPVFSELNSAADLEGLIQTLPEKSRKLLEMVKLEGLSIAEAAARAQMSESAVKVSIHRALKKLRGKIGKAR